LPLELRGKKLGKARINQAPLLRTDLFKKGLQRFQEVIFIRQ